MSTAAAAAATTGIMLKQIYQFTPRVSLKEDINTDVFF